MAKKITQERIDSMLEYAGYKKTGKPEDRAEALEKLKEIKAARKYGLEVLQGRYRGRGIEPESYFARASWAKISPENISKEIEALKDLLAVTEAAIAELEAGTV